ncbi:MAG: hypothetical protein ACRYFV_15495 [Janthinobacterium lividum]
MPVLTRDELNGLNPDKLYRLKFVLHYEQWSNLDPTILSHLHSPVKLKFDDNIRNSLGAIKNKKGVYIFMIEPDFPNVPTSNYLVYVGEVTAGNTFFKRFYDYVSAIGDRNKRRNIQLLTNLWPDKTWVYFYELSLTDAEIEAIESNLYDNIIPPLNNKFKAKKAKNSRSLYS